MSANGLSTKVLIQDMIFTSPQATGDGAATSHVVIRATQRSGELFASKVCSTFILCYFKTRSIGLGNRIQNFPVCGQARRLQNSEPGTPYGRVRRETVFSLVPDILFDCPRVFEYAKKQTVLQSVKRATHWANPAVVKTLSKEIFNKSSCEFESGTEGWKQMMSNCNIRWSLRSVRTTFDCC